MIVNAYMHSDDWKKQF